MDKTSPSLNDPLAILNGRSKSEDSTRYGYLLPHNNLYGIDTAFPDDSSEWVDEKNMALWIPIADGNRRDGVGDLLEVSGIVTERHQKNPIVLFDHGKKNEFPIAMAAERGESGKYDLSKYTLQIDAIAKTAKVKAYFYQTHIKPEHALFCEQLFDMACKRMLGAGSIGYQNIKTVPLQPDYQTGTPQGLHLLKILMLEGSLVVLPANMDTVAKTLRDDRLCGKPLSPYLVKSLQPFAPEEKATVVSGFETEPKQSLKSLREKYRIKGNPLGPATPFASQRVRGGGKVPGVDYAFMAGDTVIARQQMSMPGDINTIFAKPGDRMKVVEVDRNNAEPLTVERNGLRRKISVSAVRKNLENVNTKALSEFCIRRNDLRKLEDEAEDMGISVREQGTTIYGVEILLEGPRNGCIVLANKYGVAATVEHKSLNNVETKTTLGLLAFNVFVDGKLYSVEWAKTKEDAEAIVRQRIKNPSAKIVVTEGPKKVPGVNAPARRDFTEEQQRRNQATARALYLRRKRDNRKGLNSDNDEVILHCSKGYVESWNEVNWIFQFTPKKYAARLMTRAESNRVIAADTAHGNNGLKVETITVGRKTLTKSLKFAEIRKKYRTGTHLRRRLKRSSPGACVIHVSKKDVSAVEEMAEAKGLKAQQMSEADGETKIKLMGDDNAADEVAKAFGRPFGKSMQTKAMESAGAIKPGDQIIWKNTVKKVAKVEMSSNLTSCKIYFTDGSSTSNVSPGMQIQKKTLGNKSMKTKTKDLPTPAPDAETEIPDEETNALDLPAEPFGSQVLRKMHGDISNMMQEYDKYMPVLDHEHVKNHVASHLGEWEKMLSTTEKLHGKHYKDHEPLTAPEDALENEEEEDVPEETEEKELDETMPASSGEEELPPVEEVAEAMHDEPENDNSEQQKALRLKYRKKQLSAKSMCSSCKKEPCSCGKKVLKKSTEVPVPLDNLPDTKTPPAEFEPGVGAKLLPHHKSSVGEAAGYLKEIGEPNSNFDDEARMKAYHYHKTLDGIGQIQREAGKSVEEDDKEKKDFSEGSPEAEAVPERTPDTPPSIPAASKFFKGLSQERAFGDPHREEAKSHCKALEELVNDDKGMEDETEVDAEMQDDGPPPAPGEMGEKDLKDDKEKKKSSPKDEEETKLLKSILKKNQEEMKKVKVMSDKFMAMIP